ncbi:preprotein translocase subunit SecE [Alicyclobacillus kakegawensis]|uniref:preprotein translocase subunit SecE n=1 Tax=Alicyclobacillus kakegawensis TaxID=392012 RepID=UPI000ACE0657|nr:preprotein translocase subunit SecE [Alicyclobacillus kakegawensis]
MAEQHITPENGIQPKRRRTGVISFFAESIAELKRVRWPRRNEVVVYTAVALATCLVMGLLVWLFDILVGWAASRVGIL